MRITNNMVTGNLLAEMQQLQNQQSTLQTEVSSGLAVSQPSDNPAAVGQTLQLEGESSQLQQYNTNANRALNVVEASYGGLNSLVQIYDRASELATEGSGTASSSEMESYATEVDELVQQALGVANGQLGSEYLYGGTDVTQAPFSATEDGNGDITAVTYNGNSVAQNIPLSSTSTISPWTTGATNTSIGGFINDLVSLRDALNSGDQTSLAAVQQNLNADENVLTTAVADNGSVQARIQSDQTQQQSLVSGIGNQISSLVNANLPTTIVNLNQTQLAYQAAMQTAANVMQLSILNYMY